MIKGIVMLKQVMLTTLAGATSVMSTAVIAHPGHDHNAESANLLHLLWVMPIVLAGVIVTKLLTDNLRRKKLERRQANEANSVCNQYKSQ